MTHAVNPRSAETERPARAQSGTRLAVRDESGPTTMLDQDLIPTEPANEPPRPPSVPSAALERYEVAMEIAPPSHEDVRDTIPSPPPERE